MSTSWPLHWPDNWGRTKAPLRSQFKTSLASAVRNVQDELRRFAKDSGISIANIVVSSNVTLIDSRPADAGVACYFRWDNIDCCIAVDRYRLPEENLQAIARVIEAERTKLRHGGLNIVRQGFRGFAALPPPASSEQPKVAQSWRSVLGLPASSNSIETAEQAYRRMVKTKHPDVGGNAAEFNRITDAIRHAREELGGR